MDKIELITQKVNELVLIINGSGQCYNDKLKEAIIYAIRNTQLMTEDSCNG